MTCICHGCRNTIGRRKTRSPFAHLPASPSPQLRRRCSADSRPSGPAPSRGSCRGVVSSVPPSCPCSRSRKRSCPSSSWAPAIPWNSRRRRSVHCCRTNYPWRRRLRWAWRSAYSRCAQCLLFFEPSVRGARASNIYTSVIVNRWPSEFTPTSVCSFARCVLRVVDLDSPRAERPFGPSLHENKQNGGIVVPHRTISTDFGIDRTEPPTSKWPLRDSAVGICVTNRVTVSRLSNWILFGIKTPKSKEIKSSEEWVHDRSCRMGTSNSPVLCITKRRKSQEKKTKHSDIWRKLNF